MAQIIEHTWFEWSRWRGRVVLFKRVSLKPLWGICIFIAGYIAVISVLLVFLSIVMEPPEKRLPSTAWLLLFALIAILFVRAFVKVYQSEAGVLLPIRAWRIGRGVKLACIVMRIPQPTTMGGTLPSAPTRWLVVSKGGGKTRRLAQVYHDLDLVKVNLALAAVSPGLS